MSNVRLLSFPGIQQTPLPELVNSQASNNTDSHRTTGEDEKLAEEVRHEDLTSASKLACHVTHCSHFQWRSCDMILQVRSSCPDLL